MVGADVMSWPSVTASAILSGEGAKTLGVTLWDRDAIAASVPWTWAESELNFSADTAWADQQLSIIRMPVWAEATAVITLTFLAKQSGGSDNADFRLKGKLYGGSFTTGGTTSNGLTGDYAPYEVTLTIPASPSWAGQVVEFALQAQHTTGGGTWNISLEQVTSNMRVVPISP